MLGDKLPQPAAPDAPQTPTAPEANDAQPTAQAAPAMEPDALPVQPTETAAPVQQPTAAEPEQTAAPAAPEPVEQPEHPADTAEPAELPAQTETPAQTEIPVQTDRTETPAAPEPAAPDWTDRFDGLEGRLNDTGTRLDGFDARFEALGKRIDGLREALDALSGTFSKRLQYDDAKEKVIDRQHAELTKLRDGLTLDLREPVLQDLASAIAKIDTMKGELSDGNTEARDMLDDIDYMLGAILDDYDVTRVDSEPGSRYNAARQRFLAKDVEATDDPAKARTIARSKAPGYVYEAGERPRVLLKEQVVMYKVVKPAPAAEVPARPADAPAAPETPDAPSSIG